MLSHCGSLDEGLRVVVPQLVGCAQTSRVLSHQRDDRAGRFISGRLPQVFPVHGRLLIR